MRFFKLLLSLAVTTLLFACSTSHYQPQPHDYSKFRQSDPHSILVLLPTSSSVDTKAPYAVLAQTTQPLAESGYYVFPVALVNETFKDNGLNDGAEIQAIDINKIRQIYNPDAILYLNVKDYGTKYKVISSVTTVTVEAKLIDAKNGSIIWSGEKNITIDSSNNSNNDIFSLIVNAVITQISNKVSDKAYIVAGAVDTGLLSSEETNSILFGPYNPGYKKPVIPVESVN